MDKVKLEQRIKELESQKLQVVANANAIEGAIMDCKYWLDELNKNDCPRQDSNL